jgi:anti-sigma-K factor RskA
VDIEKYISSGILESYVLDQLTDQERAEVDMILKAYPEVQNELNQIEESLEQLALNTAIKAPSNLKGDIFSKLEEGDESAEVQNREEAKHAPVIPLQTVNKRNTKVWPYAVAASLTVGLFSSYLAYDYRQKWKAASKDQLDLKTSNQLISNQYDQVNQRLNLLENDLKVLGNINFEKIKMNAIDETQSIAANVYWNSTTQEAYLNTGNLQELPEEKQYQLWAIVEGAPVDMGVFDAGSSYLLKMKDITGASMFAVTIEPKGGSKNPTLEAMQVAGKIS